MEVLDSWGWGTGTSESQLGREPRGQSPQARLCLQGTFTYLPRLVSAFPSFLIGASSRQLRPAVNEGKGRGEGRGRRGAPLRGIHTIPVSGRGAGFVITCPGRDSGKGQSI